jgi:hypothetical protein
MTNSVTATSALISSGAATAFALSSLHHKMMWAHTMARLWEVIMPVLWHCLATWAKCSSWDLRVLQKQCSTIPTYIFFMAYTLRSMVYSNNHYIYPIQTHKLITAPYHFNNKYKKYVLCLEFPCLVPSPNSCWSTNWKLQQSQIRELLENNSKRKCDVTQYYGLQHC